MNKLLQYALVFFLVISLTSGCTTLRQINPNPRVLAETIQAGDSVRITTRNGVVLELVVQEQRDDQIIGEHEKVAVPDIAVIEKREYSRGRTAGLITIGVTTTLVVVLMAMFLIFAPMAGP